MTSSAFAPSAAGRSSRQPIWALHACLARPGAPIALPTAEFPTALPSYAFSDYRAWRIGGCPRNEQAVRKRMPVPPLLPQHEALRRAVAWLAERGAWTAEHVEEASRRFDLSPIDEEFLLNETRRLREQGTPPR